MTELTTCADCCGFFPKGRPHLCPKPERRIKIGDFVVPKPEWTKPPFDIVPSGRVVGFGMNGLAAYLEGRRGATGTYVFDVVENPTAEQIAASQPTKPEPAKTVQADMFAKE